MVFLDKVYAPTYVTHFTIIQWYCRILILVIAGKEILKKLNKLLYMNCIYSDTTLLQAVYTNVE